MSENLWKLRARKGYSLPQLAAKSGVPQQLLFEYEQGKPLKSADQTKLARALYVQPNDIALISTPPPASAGPGQRTPMAGSPPRLQPQTETREPREPRDARPPMKKGGKPVQDRTGPARPSQIEHLQNMAVSRGHTPEQLLETVGKPLETLTLEEASKWNLHYRDLPRVAKGNNSSGNKNGSARRAALPEGLDKYEYEYLAGAQQDQAKLTLNLFNGEQITGQLIGFSLYTFVLRQDNDHEITVQKLAIAYYSRSTAPTPSAGATV